METCRKNKLKSKRFFRENKKVPFPEQKDVNSRRHGKIRWPMSEVNVFHVYNIANLENEQTI